MKRLSEQGYWDAIYHKKDRSYFGGDMWISTKHLMRNYADFIIWERIFPKHLSGLQGRRAIEVGCAPGKNLIALKRFFKVEPYGVEYTQTGFDITKMKVSGEGIPSDNIILADFFDTSFQEKYKNSFDIVYSKGFIEHFDKPKDVVASHKNILKSDGVLIIQIPNLSGINFYLSKFFNIESHKLHNTSIMNKKSFERLFEFEDVDIIFLNYVGLFNIGLFNTSVAWKEKLRLLVYYFVQQPLNFIFRVLSYVYEFECRFSSPYLLAIAKKK